MAAARVDRRLAAILAADVVGYSRLIERDEAGTLERLKEHRKSFIEPLIAEHHGRIVKLMGDGVLCRVRQRGQCRRLRDCCPARDGGARGGNLRGPTDSLPASASILGDVVLRRRRSLRRWCERRRAPRATGATGWHRDLGHRLRPSARASSAAGFEDLGEQRVKNIARTGARLPGGLRAGRERPIIWRE